MGKVVLWRIEEKGGARSGAETRESDYRWEEAPEGWAVKWDGTCEIAAARMYGSVIKVFPWRELEGDCCGNGRGGACSKRRRRGTKAWGFQMRIFIPGDTVMKLFNKALTQHVYSSVPYVQHLTGSVMALCSLTCLLYSFSCPFTQHVIFQIHRTLSKMKDLFQLCTEELFLLCTDDI